MPTWSRTAPGWGPHERERLRQVRKSAGHSQLECARLLREDFSVAGASQANVTRWETGKIARPQCVEAIFEYCDTYAEDAGADSAAADCDVADGAAAGVDSAGLSTAAHEPGALAAAGTAEGSFERIVSDITDQPLLAPLQAELMSAIAHRLAHGPPLSPDDRAIYLDQIRILGIDSPPGPNPRNNGFD